MSIYIYTKRMYRIKRVSQEIQRKVAIIIQHEVKDPRIGVPTISEVQVSNDLRYAKIFITFMDKNNFEEIHSAMIALKQTSRFIRFLLASSINLRVVPRLLFKYDSSLMTGLNISNLILKSKLN